MRFLARLVIVAGWTLCAFVLLGFLLLLFTFGDCEAADGDCIRRQAVAGQIVRLVVLGIYALGLGILVKRWFFRSAR